MLNKRIVFEDNHLLIVNKQSGELIQGDITGDRPLIEKLKQYIKHKYNKAGNVFLGLPHRLDRPVSGLVIFARTSKALTRINKLFSENQIKKTYYAKVEGQVLDNRSELIHWLERKNKQNKSIVFKRPTDKGKKSILTFHKLKTLKHHTILSINLKTGRHHQIRAQLSAIGHPIKGDVKYGAKTPKKDLSIDLISHKLEFIHPVTRKRISFYSEIPPEFYDH